jgi:hypothetical protein
MSYKNAMMDCKNQSARKNENELMLTEYEINSREQTYNRNIHTIHNDFVSP